MDIYDTIQLAADYLEHNPSVEYNPWPSYDPSVLAALGTLNDLNYFENHERISGKSVDEMTTEDIASFYTFIARGERFCDGHIASFIENGTLIKLFRRHLELMETDKYSRFIHIAGLLNRQLSVYPLLYGSLGLEKRLSADLNADDIDVLIPEVFLKTEWQKLVNLMDADGYRLVDEHEHEFCKGNITVAFADLEGLTSFAGIDISAVPVIKDRDVVFLLPELPDFLKVYEASSKDGYRKNVKNKQDNLKISLIKKALEGKK